MRLESASAFRNESPILEVLQRLLADKRDVIEIASGSGQHASAFTKALPGLRWWPTDYDARSVESIDIWRTESGQENFQQPRVLDVTSDVWRSGGKLDGLPESADAIVCVNMIHISPWAATEGLFEGAARRLAPDGLLYTYGPYAREGQHTSEGNQNFDASLRAQNPDWGIRHLEDIERLGDGAGLGLEEVIQMPANNLSLVFRK